MLGDRLRTAVWDVREDCAPDPVQAALDLTQHLDERSVGAALREDRMKLVVVATERQRIHALHRRAHQVGRLAQARDVSGRE